MLKKRYWNCPRLQQKNQPMCKVLALFPGSLLFFFNRDTDKFQTISNEAYNVVQRSGGTDGEYEVVSVPRQDLPPSTSSSSQPTTTAPAGDYETV